MPIGAACKTCGLGGIAPSCRFTEWFGLKGVLKPVQFQPPAVGSVATHQIRLPTAPSKLAYNTSMEVYLYLQLLTLLGFFAYFSHQICASICPSIASISQMMSFQLSHKYNEQFSDVCNTFKRASTQRCMFPLCIIYNGPFTDIPVNGPLHIFVHIHTHLFLPQRQHKHESELPY